jgi:hypothetical protein
VQTHGMVRTWGMLVASGQVMAVAVRDGVLERTVLSRFPCLKAYSAGKQPTRVAGMSTRSPTRACLCLHRVHPHACIAQARKANSTHLDQRALTPQHIQ